MSEITRRDLYICAYIAQGSDYDDALSTVDSIIDSDADAALAAAGEKESETDFVMNHPLYKDMQAEISRLTADNAGLTISRDVHRTECLRLVHEHGKLTDEIASLKRQAEPGTVRIPASDWERMVKFFGSCECDYTDPCDIADDDVCPTCVVKDIIARTKEANMDDKPKARASGPLWVATYEDGSPFIDEVHDILQASYNEPYRLLPGHGRWVPAELVAAIEVAAHEFDKVTPFVNDGVAAAWAQFVDVIRAAREGEV